MSKRKLTYKDFINYFSNNLQNKDKHAFEKDMMRDAFEEEAFDGLSQLSKTELENDISELKSTIRSKSEKRNPLIPVWIRYAASIIILVGIGISIVYLNSKHWQDSMLKEQVSDEMEIADSMLLEAEEIIPVTKQDTFKEAEAKDLVADNKTYKKEEKAADKEKHIEQEKKTVPVQVVEDDVAIEEGLAIDDVDVEADKTETIDVVEFEEAAEVVEEEIPVYAEAQPKVEIAKKSREKSAAESPKILIRGTTAPSKGQSDQNNYKIISGTVLGAEDGLSIPGVSVYLKGNPTIGTTTNTDGKFSLILSDDQDIKTLIASYVGMETMEINLEEDSSLMVYMETSSLGLDEIVVSGVAADNDYEEKEPHWESALPPDSLSRIEYKKLVEQSLDYSKFESFPGKYKIKVEFTVFENGRLGNFNFKNAPDKIFSDEIIRVIKELGNWKSAQENNINIASQVKYTLKIKVDKSN